MITEDYKQLFTEITELKTKIAIADFFISTFKESDSDTLEKIELLKARVDILDAKLYNELKDIDRTITLKIANVEQSIQALNSKLDNVSKNTFLEFTNNLDIKKWLIIISTVISIMLGNGVVDNIVSDEIVKDPEKEKIKEVLLEINKQLKEEQPKNISPK